MILEINKLDTCYVVPNCYRTEIPFHFEMLLFNLPQGLAVPQKILTVDFSFVLFKNHFAHCGKIKKIFKNLNYKFSLKQLIFDL